VWYTTNFSFQKHLSLFNNWVFIDQKTLKFTIPHTSGLEIFKHLRYQILLIKSFSIISRYTSMLSPILSRHYQMQTSGIPDIYTNRSECRNYRSMSFRSTLCFQFIKMLMCAPSLILQTICRYTNMTLIDPECNMRSQSREVINRWWNPWQVKWPQPSAAPEGPQSSQSSSLQSQMKCTSCRQAERRL